MRWRATAMLLLVGVVAGVGATLLATSWLARRERSHAKAVYPGGAAPSITSLPPRSPAEIDRDHRAHSEALASALAAEPRNDQWASKAEEALRRDLAGLADAGAAFTGPSVECKSTICAASLRWPNYRQALQGYTLPLEAIYELNCRRSIYLAPPEDPLAAYQATLYLDCRERGAASADAVGQTRDSGVAFAH